MGEAELLDILRESLWLAFVISLPVLGVSLVVGLVIGLIQALTSIQEMTLTFVPKLGAILVVFWVTMAFSGQALVTFYQGSVVPRIERR
jgi:flagellar biosynthetic protein FliQ